MADFSHLNEHFEAQMVDVGSKSVSARSARVSHQVGLSSRFCEQACEATVREIITTARIAAIQAAKMTSQLIPMCHQVNLDKVDVNIQYIKENKTFLIL